MADLGKACEHRDEPDGKAQRRFRDGRVRVADLVALVNAVAEAVRSVEL